jgi:hypothetical protein
VLSGIDRFVFGRFEDLGPEVTNGLVAVIAFGLGDSGERYVSRDGGA